MPDDHTWTDDDGTWEPLTPSETRRVGQVLAVALLAAGGAATYIAAGIGWLVTGIGWLAFVGIVVVVFARGLVACCPHEADRRD